MSNHSAQMLAAAFSSGLIIHSGGGPVEASATGGEAGAESAERPRVNSRDAEPPPPMELLDLPLEMLVLIIDQLPSGRCAVGAILCVRWLGVRQFLSKSVFSFSSTFTPPPKVMPSFYPPPASRSKLPWPPASGPPTPPSPSSPRTAP